MDPPLTNLVRRSLFGDRQAAPFFAIGSGARSPLGTGRVAPGVCFFAVHLAAQVLGAETFAWLETPACKRPSLPEALRPRGRQAHDTHARTVMQGRATGSLHTRTHHDAKQGDRLTARYACVKICMQKIMRAARQTVCFRERKATGSLLRHSCPSVVRGVHDMVLRTLRNAFKYALTRRQRKGFFRCYAHHVVARATGSLANETATCRHKTQHILPTR